MAHRNELSHNPHENEHEDDHSDDEKEDHHHDEHSKHAHKHGEVKLTDGSHFKFNIFDHYPEHGADHHTHTVPVPTTTGKMMMTFYHAGAEHKDVPKSDVNAWIYNDKRNMNFPCKDKKPLAVASIHGSEVHTPKGKSAAPSPSAPPLSPTHHADLPPPYNAHAFDVEARSSAHASTMYGERKAARVEKQKQLDERLMQAAAPDKEPDCCRCTIS